MTTSVVVCVPTTGTIRKETFQTLYELHSQCKAAGIQLRHCFEETRPLWHSRDTMAARIIADATATHLLFLDADVAVEARYLMAMIQANLSFVGIAYRKKQDPDNLLHEYTLGAGNWRPAMANGAAPVDHISVGVSCISRECLTDTAETFKHLEYIAPSTRKLPGIFQEIIEVPSLGRCFMSEDYAFCERAAIAGHQPYVLIDAPTRHFGGTSWAGNLKDVWHLIQQDVETHRGMLAEPGHPLNARIKTYAVYSPAGIVRMIPHA